MLLRTLDADPDSFRAATGWAAKPEGLCKGELCIPAPGALRPDGRLDIAVVADRLHMPLVHDEPSGTWALGPARVGGTELDTAVVPPIVLEDVDGNPFGLDALHGRKVLLVAWASW